MAAEPTTKEQILNAAQAVFQEKGYSGGTLRDIADEADVNKGLIHYYFKTKRRLFETIFSVAFNQLHSRIQTLLEVDMPLEEKIDSIIDQTIELLLNNPDLPRFVLYELHTSPDLFFAKGLVREQGGTTFVKFQQTVQQQARKKQTEAIDARHLLMNLISMVVFPFVGRPMLQLAFGADDKEFHQLLTERQEHIKTFVRHALRP